MTYIFCKCGKRINRSEKYASSLDCIDCKLKEPTPREKWLITRGGRGEKDVITDSRGDFVFMSDRGFLTKVYLPKFK